MSSVEQACGALVVDKPSGPSSFAVCAGARRLYGTRRIGHCGTLDPMASGVMVVLVGEATKLSSVLTTDDKHYEAQIAFGVGTDTLDALGISIAERTLEPGWSSAVNIERLLDEERERTQQVPPQFSAIKTAGRRAYHSARRGEHVELPPRPVRVEQLRCRHFDDQRLVLELHVSKGYYVRSLARDVCAALGVPGHLAALRRTASGAFSLDHAVTWPRSEPVPLLSMSECVRRCMPWATLNDEGIVRARQGKLIDASHFATEPPRTVAGWLAADDSLVALGGPVEGEPNLYRVRRGFTIPAARVSTGTPTT